MTAIRFAMWYNQQPECPSSRDCLDDVFARPYKAKKHGRMVP